jgi:uncharacterized protein YbjQ (UPF0145 family)
MLVVTTDDIPGYEIRQVLGEAIGVTGRTRNPYREGVRKLHGGGNPQLVKALTRWRLDAVDQMIHHAQTLGANAVVAMRFDHRNVTDMWGEICAYGTAVVAVPVSPSTPSLSTQARQRAAAPGPGEPAEPQEQTEPAELAGSS